MIKIGNKQYKVCLFDTNALSFIIKHETIFHKIFKEYPFPEYTYAYSPYVLFEIGRNKELLDRYIHFFSYFPSLLLKNEVELFFEEVNHYCNGVEPSIWSINPSSIIGEGKSYEKLFKVFSLVQIEEKFAQLYQMLEKNYKTMLDWSDWAKMYEIDKKNKNILNFRIIETFAANCIGSYLKNSNCNDDLRNHLGKNIIIEIISTAWFYKFVSDKQRKTNINDVVDILNITGLPYSDVFIGENNINNVIIKMQRKGICKSVILKNAIDYLKESA